VKKKKGKGSAGVMVRERKELAPTSIASVNRQPFLTEGKKPSFYLDLHRAGAAVKVRRDSNKSWGRKGGEWRRILGA